MKQERNLSRGAPAERAVPALEHGSIGLNQIGALLFYFNAHLIRKPFYTFRDALPAIASFRHVFL